MRLLVLAQAVDRNDGHFGVFVDWLRDASEVFSSMLVFALRVDKESIPKEVTAVTLRSSQENAALVAMKLWRESWRRRHEYDGVFVRGDAIYLVLAGWLWRLLGKRIIFWYTHYQASSWLFWVGQLFAHEVVTATAGSNPLRRAKVIGHHVASRFFQVTREEACSTPLRGLVLGRVSRVKRISETIQAVSTYLQDGSLWLDIVGPGIDEGEERMVASHGLPRVLRRNERVRYDHLPRFLTDYDILLSATPDSMDKVILEAAATGMVVLATSRGWRETIQELPEASWLAPATMEGLGEGVHRVLALSLEARKRLGKALSLCVQAHHAQRDQILRLHDLFTS